LINPYKYAIIVATMYIDTSRITRGGKTYTRHLLRESYRAHGKVLPAILMLEITTYHA
jgi:hypothetical protein